MLRYSNIAMEVTKQNQSTISTLDASNSDIEVSSFDYEELRLRNIQDNETFLSSLGIAMNYPVTANKRTRSKISASRSTKKGGSFPQRKSLRLQRIDPSGAPLPQELEPVQIQGNIADHETSSSRLCMLDPIEQELKDRKYLADYLKSIKNGRHDTRLTSLDLSSFVETMNLSMCTVRKQKVCKERIFSTAFLPSCNRLLAVAGDKWGRIGFWDVASQDSEGGVVTFQPHSGPVSHVSTHPAHPHHLYSCSYDASFRRLDMEKGAFEEIYSLTGDDRGEFRSFDFVSPTSVLLAQLSGDVAHLDVRSSRNKPTNVLRVSKKSLRTVSVHPTDSNFFCSAGMDMCVRVWDLRRMKGQSDEPLHSLTHARSVSSAYFSPLTGSHIVTCSLDDTIGIYRCSSSCGSVERVRTVSHNNQTGRWLTPFRAVWHPVREDVFFVGSMKPRPRRIEAFGVNGKVLHSFEGERLSSICSVVQFHPLVNALVGGNSSGYLFCFHE